MTGGRADVHACWWAGELWAGRRQGMRVGVHAGGSVGRHACVQEEGRRAGGAGRTYNKGGKVACLEPTREAQASRGCRHISTIRLQCKGAYRDNQRL